MKHSLNDIRLYQAGDSQAFKRLMEKEAGRMLLFIHQYIRSQDDAEDLFQQIWLRLWQRREQLRSPQKFESWIYQVARRMITDEARRNAWGIELQFFGELSEELDLPDRGEAPQVQLEQQEWNLALDQALGQLDSQTQSILALRFKAELTLTQIGQTLNLPLGRVYYLMKLGLRQLRRELTRQGFVR